MEASDGVERWWRIALGGERWRRRLELVEAWRERWWRLGLVVRGGGGLSRWKDVVES